MPFRLSFRDAVLISALRREKAVKDLLARSAPLLDDWVMRGLAGSLKIPLAWVNEAKVILTMTRCSTVFSRHA